MTILNIEVVSIKTNTATIRFDEDSSTKCQIEYGLTTSYENITPTDDYNFFHIIQLNNLLEATIYNFRIRVTDYYGIEIVSSNYTFTTRTQLQVDNLIKTARGDNQLPKVYYVSPTPLGNNSNDGLSQATPWATPSYAVSKALAGDTIYLMNGTWNSEKIIFSKSGIDIALITLTAINSGMSILDGIDLQGYGITVGGISTNYTTNYINISNLKIGNYGIDNRTIGGTWVLGSCIHVREATNVHISDCELYNAHGTEGGIMFLDSQWCSIKDSVVHNTRWNMIGIQTGYNPTHHISVINCELYGGLDGDGHNGIDLNNNPYPSQPNNYVRYVNLYGNYMWGGPDNYITNAIFEHGVADNSIFPYVNICNNIVTNSYGIRTAMLQNSFIYNNNISNSVYGLLASQSSGYPEGWSQNGTIYIENTISNCQQETNLIIPNGTEVTFLNNNINVYRIDSGMGIIINPNYNTYSIQNSYNGSSTLKYTNNKMFSKTGSAGITYYPDRSEFVMLNQANTLYNVTAYPMYAKLSSGYTTFIINASSALLPNTVYNIKINNIQNSTITTNSTGTASISLTPIINDTITVDNGTTTQISVTVTSTTGSSIFFTFGESTPEPCPTLICSINIT